MGIPSPLCGDAMTWLGLPLPQLQGVIEPIDESHLPASLQPQGLVKQWTGHPIQSNERARETRDSHGFLQKSTHSALGVNKENLCPQERA